MASVTNLKLALQSGTDSTYYATWDFKEPAKIYAEQIGNYRVGEWVTIQSGATWYNGVSISSWVFNETWKITQIKGARAVLGRNKSGTHNIQSAINVGYLIKDGSGTDFGDGTRSVSFFAAPRATSYVDYYQVEWRYSTGDGIFFVGSNSQEKVHQSTYTVPSNAISVMVYVKPVAKKHKVNGKDVAYWTATKASAYLNFAGNPPAKPNAPSVKIDKYTLTATIDNIDDPRTDQIAFEVYSGATRFKTSTVKVQTCRAVASFTINPGSDYRVRCRAVNLYGSDKIYGEWSDYSNSAGTVPAAPKEIISIKATSDTSVQLKWEKVENATSFTIEYTTKQSYFDQNPGEVKSVTSTAYQYAQITGMESGQEYFFRVRAVNDNGESSWTAIKSIVIGKSPSAPTTWSSTTTAITGEELLLYWVHNAEDGSSQTFAELEIYYDEEKITHTIENKNVEEDKDRTSFYSVDTTKYKEGTIIKWRVRTAGVTKQYGDWSIQRTVNVYAPATLSMNLTDNQNNIITTVNSFPIYLKCETGPNTQMPIGYHVEITSNEVYTTVDEIGNKKIINAGEALYSQYFDTKEQLLLEISAHSIDLENTINYTVKCTVSMDSGLTSEAELDFDVSWTEFTYEPDAEIGIDEETYTAYISPYCLNEMSEAVADVELSVYRKEFDGTFTEIATGLSPLDESYVTDPHPALDYARYRIVATSKSTGSVSYYDPPGYPVGGNSVIIQWDDEWTNFNTTEDEELETPPWVGSMLKIPYNIDVSDNNKPDSALVNYIGRKYPVSYYGTHVGASATWNMVIPKEDKDTLYALRRLSVWMGDVYVREPSGSGYWANITVSFNQKHSDVTIPVTLDITRVEGGI